MFMLLLLMPTFAWQPIMVNRPASASATVPRSTLFQSPQVLPQQQRYSASSSSSSSSTVLFSSTVTKDHRQDGQQQLQTRRRQQQQQQGIRSNTPFLTLATEWVEYVIMEDDEKYNNKNRKSFFYDVSTTAMASTKSNNSSNNNNTIRSRRVLNHRIAAMASNLFQKIVVTPSGPLPTVACTLLVALSWIAVRQSMILLATAALACFPASSSTSMAALALLS
jgi:hypothetical protein